MYKLTAILLLALSLALSAAARAKEPVRVGALYSVTGTMAISETSLRDALLMLVKQQNQRWGVLGCPAEVRNALPGLEVANLSGGLAKMHSNHHLSKPVYIGQIRPDGQYDVIWQSNGSVTGDPWFDPVSAQSEEERQ